MNNNFKSAAITFASEARPEVLEGAFVFKADRAAAEKILLDLLDKNVLEEKFVTGAERKVDKKYQEYQVEISREWDPNGSDYVSDHGAWDIKYGTRRELVSEKHSIVYRQPESERPVDVQYDAQKGTLTIAAWAINTKPLQEVLQNGSPEASRKALLSLANAGSAQSLVDAFNAVSKIKPLAVEETLDLNKVRAFQAEVAAATKATRTALASSGITENLKPQEINSLVKKITGQKLDVLAA